MNRDRKTEEGEGDWQLVSHVGEKGCLPWSESRKTSGKESHNVFNRGSSALWPWLTGRNIEETENIPKVCGITRLMVGGISAHWTTLVVATRHVWKYTVRTCCSYMCWGVKSRFGCGWGEHAQFEKAKWRPCWSLKGNWLHSNQCTWHPSVSLSSEHQLQFMLPVKWETSAVWEHFKLSDSNETAVCQMCTMRFSLALKLQTPKTDICNVIKCYRLWFVTSGISCICVLHTQHLQELTLIWWG